MFSARTLSLHDIICGMSTLIGCDLTSARTVSEPVEPRVTVTPLSPAALANARPASPIGSLVRGLTVADGSALPPSTMSAVTSAWYPSTCSLRSHESSHLSFGFHRVESITNSVIGTPG